MIMITRSKFYFSLFYIFKRIINLDVKFFKCRTWILLLILVNIRYNIRRYFIPIKLFVQSNNKEPCRNAWLFLSIYSYEKRKSKIL